jgi:hypothetical protein
VAEDSRQIARAARFSAGTWAGTKVETSSSEAVIARFAVPDPWAPATKPLQTFAT